MPGFGGLFMALALLIKIGSLFIIALGAYALVKFRVLRSEDSRTLSLIMLYLICPCTIISAFQIDSTPELRSGLLLAFAAAVIIHIGLLLFNLLIRKPLRMSPVQIVLQWTHCKPLISGETHLDVKKIITNVNMIAIFLGIVIFALGIKLPKVVQDAIDTTAVMIGPMSMLMIGMMLAGMDLKSIFVRKRIWLVVFLRLIVAPLLFIVFLRISGFGSSVQDVDTIMLISLLACASASAATVTQMEQIYGDDAEYACSINVLTTLLCIITMPLIVLVYQL